MISQRLAPDPEHCPIGTFPLKAIFTGQRSRFAVASELRRPRPLGGARGLCTYRHRLRTPAFRRIPGLLRQPCRGSPATSQLHAYPAPCLKRHVAIPDCFPSNVRNLRVV
jgi:hypothetical protein